MRSEQNVFSDLRYLAFTVYGTNKQNCVSRFYGSDVLYVRVNAIAVC
jgi:hypothetical protein